MCVLDDVMAAALALVDVNRETAVQTWPLLLEAVRAAHFTALDLVSDVHEAALVCAVTFVCAGVERSW